MAITPLLWRALERAHAAYRFMWKNPMEWNPEDKKFEHTPFSWGLLCWTVSMILIFVIFILPCTIIVLFHIFGFVKIPVSTLVTASVLGCLSGFCFTFEIMFLSLGRIIGPVFAIMKKLNKDVAASQKTIEKAIDYFKNFAIFKLGFSLNRAIRQNFEGMGYFWNLDELDCHDN